MRIIHLIMSNIDKTLTIIYMIRVFISIFFFLKLGDQCNFLSANIPLKNLRNEDSINN